MSQSESSPQSQTLSRELSVFLVQLSIGLHKFGTYPAGHPVVDEAIDSVYLHLLALLTERDHLALGIARQQLIVDGAATDPNSPVLNELADRLHRHHVGALRFSQGVTAGELSELLQEVSREPNREGIPFGLRPREDLDRWSHLQVIPLAFEQLQLAGEGGENEATSRESQLWLGLAAAAMLDDSAGDDSVGTDPSQVAQAINHHHGDRTYDQVIVGYIQQLGQELKTREGVEAKALQERITRLLESLDGNTLRRLMDVGGDLAQRGRMLSDISSSLPVTAVLDLVNAAAEANQQTISHSLLRLLTKLADHADAGGQQVRPQADETFRESIKSLLEDWQLEDPNPDAYTRVLEKLATPETDGAPPELADSGSEAPRIIQMGMEVGVFGEAVAQAVQTMLAAGKFQELLAILDGAPDSDESAAAAAQAWDYLAAPTQVGLILEHEEEDLTGVQRVLERLGAEAAETLIDALATADSRAMRHRLLSTLTAIGSAVGPVAVARLEEAEWYVQRNLLILLGTLPEWPPEFTPERYALHENSRVRREALKVMLQSSDPQLHDAGVKLGAADEDMLIVRMALTAAIGGCPVDAERKVLEHLSSDDGDIRVLAVRVLGSIKANRARDLLIGLALAKRKWWSRRRRLAAPSPEMLAALNALATEWADVAEVRSIIQLAERHSDPAVRKAVEDHE